MRTRVLALTCSMIVMTTVAASATDQQARLEGGPHVHLASAPAYLSTPSSGLEIKLVDIDRDQPPAEATVGGVLVVYHRAGKPIEKEDVAAAVPGELSFPSRAAANFEDANGKRDGFLLAVGVYEAAEFTFTDFVFDDLMVDEFNVRDEAARIAERLTPLLDEGGEPVRKVDKAQNVGALSAPSGTTHITSFSGTCRDSANGNVSAGNLSNVFTQVSRGSTAYNGKGATLWDSKARHTSSPYNNYQTREIRTRHDQGHWFSQDVISHGPYTTTSGHSVTVSLGVKGPTISWSFQKPDVRIYDTSSLPNYTRWVFDFVLGTNSSRYTYVSEPGLRIVNTVGQVAFRNQVHMYYYRNLTHYCMMNIGPVDRWFNDR